MIPAVETYLRMVLNYAFDVPQGKVPFYLTLQEQSSGYNKLIVSIYAYINFHLDSYGIIIFYGY
jgi:hypothetical protein